MAPKPIPRKREVKRVTIAAGLMCEGGVVLCADSQETAGDFKWSVEKLAISVKYGSPIMIAGSGFGPAVDTAAEKIIDAVEGGYSTLEPYLAQIERILRDIHQNDLPYHPATKTGESGVDLLIAFHVNGHGAHLYRTSGSLLKRVKYFDVIGSGMIVNYFAHSLYRKSAFNRPDLSLAEGKLLGAYLAYQAKRQLATVGGRSVIAALDHQGELRYAQDWEVPQLERFFGQFEWLQGQLMLAAVNTQISSDQFEKRVNDFAEMVKKRKDELLEEARQWEEVFRPYPVDAKDETSTP